MVYAPHYRVTWGGSLQSGEVWQMGIACGQPYAAYDPGDDVGDTIEQMVERAENRVADVGGRLKQWWATDCGARQSARLTWAKVAVCVSDPDDPYKRVYADAMGLTPIWEDASPAQPGTQLSGNGNANPPPQVALALSHRTERRRGVGVGGRTYLPCVQLATNSGTDTIQQTVAEGILDKWQDLATDLPLLLGNPADAGGPPDPLIQHVVATPGSSKTNAKGGNFAVVEYRVGRRHDTIRRRARQIPENYVSTED